jgi:hypothetical protein
VCARERACTRACVRAVRVRVHACVRVRVRMRARVRRGLYMCVGLHGHACLQLQYLSVYLSIYLSFYRLAGPGRLMDDTVWGAVFPEGLEACAHLQCLRRSWREALSSSVCIDSHIYMNRKGLISRRHENQQKVWKYKYTI